jgi:SAM-dependent methyltransferase
MDDAQAKERYECVPYPSKPQEFIHPEPLAVISTIFGGMAPPIDKSRVLEIGCADGSNAIAIGHYLPGTEVVGIDISREAIERGRATLKRLRLTNVELYAVDLREFQPRRAFDYVLCHGLWSWVDASTRSSLLRLIRSVLTPEGVALISYNTWPGWHTLRPARDVMQLVAERTDGNAGELVRSGLDFLELAMPHIARNQSVYGGMLSHATYTMEGHSESYLFHDFLAPVNQPFYFRDFVSALEPHGLRYLGEASFGQLMPYELPDELAERIDHLAPDLVTLGQFLDYVRNTAFRVSLICPHERVPNRSLDSSSLTKLHVRLVGQELSESTDESGAVWQAADGKHVAAVDALTREILKHCSAQSDGSLPVATLYKLCNEATEEGPDSVAARLLRLYAAGVVELRTRAIPSVALKNETPKTNILASFQLEEEEEGVSTANNSYVELDRFERALLTRCDGERTIEVLLEDMLGLVKSGDLEVTIGGVPAKEDSMIREVVAALLPVKLEQLARLGLLG